MRVTATSRPDSMSWSACNASNNDVWWAGTDGNAVIAYVEQCVLRLRKRNWSMNFMKTVNKVLENELECTGSNDGVLYLNMGWATDINAISVGAWFWSKYMEIRDGYTIAAVYTDMVPWAVDMCQSK